MAVDKRRLKEGVMANTKYSYEHREDSGMYGNIFKPELEGVPFWKCAAGEHVIDIIPFIVGKHYPIIQSKPVPEGFGKYLLEIWVHMRVGVNLDSFVCPSINYKLPCPICEYREELRKQDDYDDELVKSLYPKHRTVYNIVCWDDSKEERKGVQVWEVSHWLFEKTVASLAHIPARGGSGGGYIYFADPDDGRSIKFERKGSGKDNTSYIGHQFLPREGYDTNQFLESVYTLDELIVIPTYKELEEAFFGRSDPVEEDKHEVEEEAPAEIEAPPAQAAAPVNRPRLITRPGATKTQVEPERQAPKPTGRQMRVSAEKECPGGGTFGISCEELDECNNCQIWDDCVAERDRLAAEEAANKPKPTGRRPAEVQAPAAAPGSGLRVPIGGGSRRGGAATTGKK